jgi:serine/threonine protein phosphatase PrpC
MPSATTDDILGTKLVSETLDQASKWGADGVDVDKRMMEGRKANRGFTISVGSTVKKPEPDAEVDVAGLRAAKRAQTMPAMSTRRSDFVLSSESQQKLTDAQAALQACRRRGSAAVSFAVVPEPILEKTWEEEADYHIHGLMTEGQSHGDERERKTYCADKPPARGNCPEPIIACHKGSKGFRDTTPNQDNFSITYFKNGITLCCTFDGHGPFGHLVSTRTVQTVPYYFCRSEHYPNDVKAALTEAFELSHKDCVALALEDGWDIQASGSTAVAAAWKGNKIWTANAGDSRCVVGSELNKTLLHDTVDHKPDTPAEKARIESLGGEVRTETYPDGWVNHRIFVAGEDYPGLCMARTLGDESVKAHGVVPTPECTEWEVDMSKQPFFVLASDGVWEFLDSSFVVKAVAKKIKSDGPEKTVQKLQREARKRWKQEEGDYCDDITSILVQLRE